MSKIGFILSGVIAKWRSEAQSAKLRETGGILVGYWTSSGYPVITHATGPGPNAKHTCCRFSPDHEYCQRLLEYLYKESAGELTYLGDWHTHPLGKLSPSGKDMRTALDIANDLDYRCPRPLIALYSPAKRFLSFNRYESVGIWCVEPSERQPQPLECKFINHIAGYDIPTLVD